MTVVMCGCVWVCRWLCGGGSMCDSCMVGLCVGVVVVWVCRKWVELVCGVVDVVDGCGSGRGEGL